MPRTALFHKDPTKEVVKECQDDGCENRHYQIDVLGAAGKAQFDCEHKSHVFVFAELTPVDPAQSGLNYTNCDHDESTCQNCSHKHSELCIGVKWQFGCNADNSGHDHTDDCPITEARGIACGIAPHRTRGKCATMQHSGDKIPA